jgi:hypothetical protein
MKENQEKELIETDWIWIAFTNAVSLSTVAPAPNCQALVSKKI